MDDVVVVGGGPTGLAAAIWCDRLGLQAVVLEGAERVGGQLLQLHSPVPDYPGFPDGTGETLAEAFAAHAARGSARLRLRSEVRALDLAARTATLHDGRVIRGGALLLAMGCEYGRLGVPGEDRLTGRGVSHSASRDAERVRDRVAVVVGGGDSAFENALILAPLCRQVHLLHRGSAFRAREDFVRAVAGEPRIRVQTGCRVVAVMGDGRVEAVTVRRAGADLDEDVPCDAVFVRIGVRPRTELVARQLALDPGGYVVAGPDQSTGVPGVYVAGDICNKLHSSIATSVGQAMVAAKSIQLARLGPRPTGP